METRRENQQSHLTDAQFADLLLGTNPLAVRAHLEVCTQCSEEAERVSGAIGSFEHHSRLWAERRTASYPLLVSPGRPGAVWLHRPQVWAAAALALAIAAGIGVTVHKDRERLQQTVAGVQPATPRPTAASLKADNALLSAIDGELRADDSARMYGLNVTSRNVRSRPSKRISN